MFLEILIAVLIYAIFILCLIGTSLLSYTFISDVGQKIGNSYLVNISDTGVNYIKFFTYILWILCILILALFIIVFFKIENSTYRILWGILMGSFVILFIVGNSILTNVINTKVSSGTASNNKLIEMTEAGLGYIRFYSVLVWIVLPLLFFVLISKYSRF